MYYIDFIIFKENPNKSFNNIHAKGSEKPPHTDMLYDPNRLFQIESILTRPENIILYVPNIIA